MNDVTKIPISLKNAPLIEAIFEMRFKSAKESAGDLLPGLIYSTLGEKYENVEALPVSSVPREFLVKEPHLYYQPLHRLFMENRQLLVGDHVVSLSQTPPYSGWNAFEAMILELIGAVKQTHLLGKLERFSVKCINLIPISAGQQLSLLNADFEIAGHAVTEKGFQFRTETEVGNFLNIVQIITNSSVRLRNGESRSGLLVDVDTICPIESEEFFGHESEHLNAAHQMLKTLFFSILTEETVASFEPTWRQQ